MSLASVRGAAPTSAGQQKDKRADWATRGRWQRRQRSSGGETAPTSGAESATGGEAKSEQRFRPFFRRRQTETCQDRAGRGQLDAVVERENTQEATQHSMHDRRSRACPSTETLCSSLESDRSGVLLGIPPDPGAGETLAPSRRQPLRPHARPILLHTKRFDEVTPVPSLFEDREIYGLPVSKFSLCSAPCLLYNCYIWYVSLSGLSSSRPLLQKLCYVLRRTPTVGRSQAFFELFPATLCPNHLRTTNFGNAAPLPDYYLLLPSPPCSIP